MPVEVYRILHLCGVFMLLSGLAALWGIYASNATPAPSRRRALAIIHGIGMLFVVVGGFGMAAKLNYGFPAWMMAKLVIWLFLGGSMMAAKRRAHLGAGLLLVWVGLATAAGCIAVFKPF